MQHIRILTLLLVVFVGIIATHKSTIQKGSEEKNSKKSESVSPTPTDTKEVKSSNDSQITIEQKTEQSTVTPTTEQNVEPTTSPQENKATSPDFQYPGSTPIKSGSTGGGESYQTTDNSQTVTNWYKDKIKSLGMKTTAFVQTSTNGNVLNKLAGSSSSTNVTIEIIKKSSENTVYIAVSF